MSRASLFVPLGVFIVILAVGYIGFSLGDRHELPSALIGQPFPEFRAPTLYDPSRVVDKTELLGRPTLVNVWATWCPTCKAEHEELLRIAADTDVALVGLNYKDRRDQALRWLSQFGDPYDLVLEDADGSIGVELGVYGAPETFLLDANGEVVYKRVGDVNARVWRDELAPRLRAMGVRMNMTAGRQDSAAIHAEG